jgi:hypothetical protein
MPSKTQAHFAGTLLFNPARLPSFTFLTSLVSLGMLLVIVLTAALNFLTQLFTLGEVSFGELLPHASSWPVLTDDWSIALLRLAGACLESSTVGGMGNEVASLRAPKEAFIDLAARSRSATSTGGYEVSIQNQDRSTRSGFGNLIRDLRAEGSLAAPQTNPGAASQPFPASPLGDWSQDSPYLREMKAFGGALWRWLLAAAWWTLGLIPGARSAWNLGTQSAEWAARIRMGRRGVWLAEASSLPAREAPAAASDVSGQEEASDAEDGLDDLADRRARNELYARFLAGETVDEQAEDDDPAFEYTPRRRRPQRERSYSSSSSSSSSYSSSDGADVNDDDDADAPLATYSELPPSPTLPPVLLAHMTSASPLTRSRYRGLILHPAAAAASAGAGPADTESVIRQRRAEASFSRHGGSEDAADDDEASLPPCAVCWAGRREILLIPCLCLAMCAECRAHMAVKTAAKDHTCPCCRTKFVPSLRPLCPQSRRTDSPWMVHLTGSLATRGSTSPRLSPLTPGFARRALLWRLQTLYDQLVYEVIPNPRALRVADRASIAEHLRGGRRPSSKDPCGAKDDLLGRSDAALEQRDSLPSVRPDEPEAGRPLKIVQAAEIGRRLGRRQRAF